MKFKYPAMGTTKTRLSMPDTAHIVSVKKVSKVSCAYVMSMQKLKVWQ